MRALDVLRYAFEAAARARMRTGLMLLAMAIGVASVVVLTSLGEAARRYVTGEFASLGTNLVIVLPGRSETTGGAPTMVVGQTPRDLTLEDALALTRCRRLAGAMPPSIIGSSTFSNALRRGTR